MIRGLLRAREGADGVAVFEGEAEITYRRLGMWARALAALLPCGTRETIALLLPDGSGFIAALWGVIQAGHTALPINPMLAGREVFALVAGASVSAVVTSAAHRSLFEGVGVGGAPCPRVIYMEEVIADAVIPVSYAPHLAPDAVIPVSPTPGDATDAPMLLLATSGTTSGCKLVMLTERNVEASLMGYLDKIDVSEAERRDARFVPVLPFSSAYGLMILSACLALACPIIILPGAFTMDAFFKAVQERRATHCEGGAPVIQMLEKLAGRAIPYDIGSLKHVGFGGSAVPGSVVEAVMRAYPGMGFYQGYGMTEAAPLIAKCRRGAPVVPASVGTAIKGVDIAILAQSGIVRTPFAEGEILVRGANVTQGYLNNAAATRAALKDGYLHTGDVGYLDGEGYLYIRGRKKNVIIVRGFKVYPEDVEACLLGCDGVEDCRVYGRTDVHGNEEVCADIVPALPFVCIEDVKRFCGERLAAYKCPCVFTLCGRVERNASGKTARRSTSSNDRVRLSAADKTPERGTPS